MSGSVTDVTDRKLAEAQLFAEKERAQVTLESIGDAVITTDVNGLIDYLNPVAEALTGWRAFEARGQSLHVVCETLDEPTRKRLANPVEVVLRAGSSIKVPANVLLLRRDGTEIAINESAAPIRDRAGAIVGVVLVLHDVRREREYATQLSYQASHDALTGLINRREFEHRLSLALTSAREQGRHHAMMYLDLDQFKLVNDTSDTPQATSSCARSACCSRNGCAKATRWLVWAATSSACCSRTARPSTRRGSRMNCARR
jgi:PAS domain S-box-containing protein